MIFNETFIENAMQSNQYLYVRQAGILHHDAHYTISRENSETGVIGFIQSGVLWIESAGNRMQVCNQESFILPNQTCYTIYADHQNPPCIYWLNLRGDLFSALCTSLLHGQILISRYHALNDILHLFTLIKDAGNVQAVIKAVFSLLTDIKFQEIEKPATQEKPEPSLVTQLDYYVCNHIQYDFSVQEMAKAFYMSTDSLNRIFQKEFQTTPYQYYQTVRTEIAKSLLVNSKLSIEDIAQRLRFTDRNYFSMYFKSKTGCTPVRFRKNKALSNAPK